MLLDPAASFKLRKRIHTLMRPLSRACSISTHFISAAIVRLQSNPRTRYLDVRRYAADSSPGFGGTLLR